MEKMKLYHVSQDIDIREKEFIPRIPKHRLRGEDSTTKRICVAPSIQQAFEGFSQKSSFINRKMRMFDKTYLNVYEFDTKYYIPSSDLQDKIPDIKITDEHWITRKITSTPSIIKMKHVELCGSNKYINEQYGQLLHFIYEADTLDHEREEEMTFLNNRRLNWCKNKYKGTGTTFEVLKQDRVHLRKCMFWDALSKYTKKRYSVSRVKVTVPAGVSMNFLWSMDSYQNHEALKKKMVPTLEGGKK